MLSIGFSSHTLALAALVGVAAIAPRARGQTLAADSALAARVGAARARDGASDSTGARGLVDARALEARIDELDQQIRILRRLRELDAESAAAKAKETPALVAGREGFSLESPDRAFQLRFRGYVQSDGRFVSQDASVPFANSFVMRRVRPVLEGTLYRNVGFRVMPDFGDGRSTLFDAHIDIHFHPAVALRAGKFKPPVGLERLQSATDLLFAERGMPTNLVPTRDVGVQLSGDIAGGALAYQAGVFNGATDLGNGDSDNGNGKDADARIFVQPFRAAGPGALRGLGIGIAGTHGVQRGTAASPFLPTYRSPAQQTVFAYRADPAAMATLAAGTHTRLSPQGFLYAGPVGVLGEYVLSTQRVRRDTSVARLANRAWQLAASIVLTGERPGFRGVTPRRPFDPASHGWGALELGARVGRLTIDRDAFPRFADPDRSVRRASELGVALNWYLARGIRLQTDYEYTAFRGGATGGDRPSEHAVITRLQLAF
ncbi:MAG TPA: porin [Gemmatimonadaceae bacterium]|nr:porin [Gemmatimonadaceae bacterium]